MAYDINGYFITSPNADTQDTSSLKNLISFEFNHFTLARYLTAVVSFKPKPSISQRTAL